MEILAIHHFDLDATSGVTPFNYPAAIVGWAERELARGGSSESLLMLAGLSLDRHPDPDDIARHLEHYLRENGLAPPEKNHAFLLATRCYLADAQRAHTLEALATRLSYLIHRGYEVKCYPFQQIVALLDQAYYRDYDCYQPLYGIDAEDEDGEAARFDHLRWLTGRLHRLLDRPEMLELLRRASARRPSEAGRQAEP